MITEEQAQFAKTVVDQLTLAQEGQSGINILRLMVGAHNFIVDKEETITFRFGGSRKCNTVKIHLNGLDLYDMTFFRIGKKTFKELETFHNIYDTMLKTTFEEFTGLTLSIPRFK